MKRIAAILLLLLLHAQGVARAAQTQPPAPILRAASMSNREVALTFDDGPSAYTAQIVSTLQRFHAHATFFLVGRMVWPLRAIVRQEAAVGDELGNHTYTHADLEWLSRRAILDELEATDTVIHAATGRRPHWFRPPYGAVNANVSSLARSLGLWTVTWSVDPQDWRLPGAARIAGQVTAQARPGSVILLHDGGGNRWQTVSALPTILRTLQARGYRLVTLDELFFPEKR